MILKLESSFRELSQLMSSANYYTARQALECIFEILQLLERVEIKMELTREAEKFQKTLPDHELHPRLIKLNGQQGKLGEDLRTNPALVSLQKRLFQTSGACVFDVPSLHAWLNADISIKQADLQMLYQPLAPLDLVIASLMQAYDLSWSFKDQFSENGLFHLHPTAQSSIVCIEIPTANPMFVPEVSLSPKAIFIKLWTQESLLGKNVPFNEPCTIKISEY